jgi:Dolichyl-phosphate-mannose-protein mannosyltransferase
VKALRRLAVPMLAGAIVRAGLMLVSFLLTGTQAMTHGDTASYLEPGRNLLLHGTFASGGLPETDRTPGYPLLMMLTGMIANNVLLTVVFQIGVSLLSMLLVSRIAEMVCPGRNAGVVAAWFFAFEPISVVYSVRLMPETYFVFLLLVVVERLLVFQEKNKLVSLVQAGLALVAATFVRPAGYYLIFVLVTLLAWTLRKNEGLRWKAPLLLLVTVLPCLAAWQMRNWIETGYSGFSSVVEKNLYFYQAAAVTAKLEQTTLAAEQKTLGYPDRESYVAVHPEQQSWPEAKRLRFMREQAGAVVAAHPWMYSKSHFAGVAVVALTPCGADLLQLLGVYPTDASMPGRVSDRGFVRSVIEIVKAHPGIAVAMALLEIYLLMMYGLTLHAWATTGARDVIVILAGIAIYFLLISGGAQAVGRYRAPVMPIVCAFAAGGYRAKKRSGTDVAPLVSA